MDNIEYIQKYFSEMQEVIGKIPVEEVSAVVDALFKAWQNGNRVFIIGNGGSASTATHMMCDLNKCTIVEGKKRFKATALVDNIPLVSALTNDDGWGEIYVEQLKNFFESGDVVIAYSVHGGSGSDKAGAWSQNLLKGLQYAKDNGGVAIGIAGFDGGAMKQMADHCIVVPVESTPHTESLHVAVEHLIANLLKEKIENEG
jgi:D-sedoheptulose 7-phosphate isomerase